MDNLKTLRKFTPHFVLELVGRYKFVKQSRSFSRRPFYSVLKLGRWMFFVWSNKDISFDTPDGTHFRSMVKNQSSFMVCFDDYRDPAIHTFLVRYLKGDSVFVDAGANIGTYTVRAAQLIGPQGSVIAIEAHPFIYGYLSQNIQLNNLDNVTALNVALGSEAGTVEMSYNPSNAGQTHVATGGGQKISVPLKTLDNILEELSIPSVDYLKIDVEGFELSLLKGAEETIAHSPNIVVQTELIDSHARRYGHPITAVIDLLSGWGLAPHTLDHEGNALLIEKSDIEIPSDILWWREKEIK